MSLVPQPPSEERARLERRANVVRWRLARTIEMLERKRHELFDVRYQLRHHVGLAVFAAGVAVVAVASIVTIAVLRLESAPARPWRTRVTALRRALAHPERQTAPAVRSLSREALGVVLTTLAAQLAKRSMARLLRGPSTREAFHVHPAPTRESP